MSGNLRRLMTNDQYLLQSKIGKGKTAKVFKAVVVATGESVAIKIINLTSLSRSIDKAPELVDREIDILKRTKHKYINELLDEFRETHNNEEFVYLVLELCDETLSRYLKKQPGDRLSEPKALHLMKQIASAFFFIRTKGIIHRDIKPDNILLKKEGELRTIKISDFGLAREIEDNDLSNTCCGTPLYMAPEIRGGRYSHNADLYSIGALLYQMVCGRVPFTAANATELYRTVDSKPVTFPHDLTVSTECEDLIRMLLKKDPSKRLTWQEFFVHPWFKGEDFTLNSPKPLSSLSNPVLRMPKRSPFIEPHEAVTHSYFYNACLEISRIAKQQGTSESLSIYIKCAQNLKGYIEYLNSCSMNSLETAQDLKLCKQFFLDLLEKITKLTDSGAQLSTQSPDNIIFKHAMKTGQRAAEKELLGLYQKSLELYSTTIFLLKYLNRRSCDTMDRTVRN